MHQPVPGEGSCAPSPCPCAPDTPSAFVVQEALALCLASAVALVGEEAEGGGIYLLNQAGTHYELVTWQDTSATDRLRIDERYSVEDERGQYLRLGIPFAVNCCRPNSDYPVLLSPSGATVTVLPFMLRSQPLGSLELLSRDQSSLFPDAVRRLEPLLGRLTSLIAHLRDQPQAAVGMPDCLGFQESVGNLFFVIGLDGKILWANQAVAIRLQRNPKELIGLPLAELHPADRRREARRIMREMLAGTRSTSHIPFLRQDGGLLCGEVCATRGHWRDRQVLIAVGRHLIDCGQTRAKFQLRQDRLEHAVAEQQGRLLDHLRLQNTMACVSRLLIATDDLDDSIGQALRLFGQRLGADRAYLFQLSPRDGTFSNTHEWCMPTVTPEASCLQGLSPDGFPWWTERMREDGRVCIPDVASLPPEAAAEQRLLQEQGVLSLVAIGISRGGIVQGFVGLDFCHTLRPIRHSAISLLRLFADALGNALDRAEAERRVKESERFLRGVLADTDALICRFDADGVLRFVNHAYAAFFGHRPEELVGADFFALVAEPVRPKVRAAFRSLTSANPAFTYEQETRRHDGVVRLQRWTDRAFFGADGTPLHYQSVGIDITDLVQARREAMEGLKHVERTLRNAVRALAKTQEIRDPYTAGHQLRVADLAVRIARHLGLGPEEQSTVYYGALLHDLGKIHIPMDILSKPTPLSSAEYSLIQCHPASGVDILREIHLDESVELITLGHHERLDGSGYPQGLRGEEITLGARIVAVSDVVDSMVSHRPYRPALPISVALGEISQHSGSKYDPQVVAACMALFTDQHYRFPGFQEEGGMDVADSLPPPPLPVRVPPGAPLAGPDSRPATHADLLGKGTHA